MNDKKIRIAIWKERLPSAKGIMIAVVLVAVLAFAILHKTPVGPTREIVAQVEAIGVTHDYIGSRTYLVCILDNGQQVRVSLNNQAPLIQKGQMVKLRESSRFLTSGKTYQFVYSSYPKVNTQAK